VLISSHRNFCVKAIWERLRKRRDEIRPASREAANKPLMTVESGLCDAKPGVGHSVGITWGCLRCPASSGLERREVSPGFCTNP